MSTSDAVTLVQRGLRAAADPDKAGPMAAYLKTDMPFYGVQKAERQPVLESLVVAHPASDRREYTDIVRALWELPHREEKYLALGYARSFDEFIDQRSVPLFEALIVEGAWWDLVDETAIKLVGRALFLHRPAVTPTVASWRDGDDLWLRRTSIICQVGHKDETDVELLRHACSVNLADTEFFIRKAIGWALRDYARTAPDWVRSYCAQHEGSMSGLSFREATKHL